MATTDERHADRVGGPATMTSGPDDAMGEPHRTSDQVPSDDRPVSGRSDESVAASDSPDAREAAQLARTIAAQDGPTDVDPAAPAEDD
jgi:hypothetical protein